MARRLFKWKSGVIPILLGVMIIATLVYAGTPARRPYGIRFQDEGAAHDTPPSGFGDLYLNSDILYFIPDGGSAVDLLNAISTATDFELAADADAGDFDIDSLDRLEFVDSGLYIDGGSDATLLISSDGTLEIATADWDISATGTITNASISADQISAAALALGANYLSIGAAPAGSGQIRLSNTNSITFEANPADTDIIALSVDSSEVIQIGSAGATGVTITPALTLGGALTVGGTVTMAANELSGTTGIINYDNFDVDASGNVDIGGTLDVTGNFTVTGAITQDAWVASGAGPTDMTIDAVGNGAITIAGTSTGIIWLGDDSGGATLVTVGNGTDLLLGEGKLTIDNSVNEDALVITSSATTQSAIEITSAATTTGNTISVVADALISGGKMLYLESGAIPSGAFYIYAYDGGGNPNFSVGEFGATIIEGNASGVDALTLTAGDILVTSGHIDITTGSITVGTGNISIGTGNLQTDAGHAAIGIGTADIETWETSPQLSALQLGGAGFWAAYRVQAEGDSSYFGHNAYFDNDSSAWEAISTYANDQSVMLQMTDGTWIFNVEDTELASDATITWIPSLIITEVGKIGMGTADAASVDENLHIESATSEKPVLKIENTNNDANGPILEFAKAGGGEADDDEIALIEFRGQEDSAHAEALFAYISVLSSDVSTATAKAGQVDIYAMVGGTNVNLVSIGGQDANAGDPAEVVINEGTADVDFRVESDGYEKALFVDGNTGLVSGDILNDQFTRIMVGQVFNILSDPLAIWAWLTPGTTEVDLTVEGHDATYVSMDTASQTAVGLTWSVPLASSDYLTVSDAADWSFVSAGDDIAMTVGFWAEIYDDGNIKSIIAKYDDTNNQIEWDIFVDAAEKVNFRFYDEEAGATAYESRITTGAVSTGWRFIVVTYDVTQQDEAASAGMLIYVDGIAVASGTDDNGGTYSDKVDGTQDVWIGAQGEDDTYGQGWVGEIGMIFAEQATLSAANIYKIWMLTRGYYNK